MSIEYTLPAIVKGKRYNVKLLLPDNAKVENLHGKVYHDETGTLELEENSKE